MHFAPILMASSRRHRVHLGTTIQSIDRHVRKKRYKCTSLVDSQTRFLRKTQLNYLPSHPSHHHQYHPLYPLKGQYNLFSQILGKLSQSLPILLHLSRIIVSTTGYLRSTSRGLLSIRSNPDKYKKTRTRAEGAANASLCDFVDIWVSG